ncbi:MAG: hypothetical protein R3B72_25275 [Polyangiaceae bacterium]
MMRVGPILLVLSYLGACAGPPPSPSSPPAVTLDDGAPGQETVAPLRCGGAACTTEAPFCCFALGDDGAATSERCVRDRAGCGGGSVAYHECHRADDCGGATACCRTSDGDRVCRPDCGSDAVACVETGDCPRGLECLQELHPYAPEDGLCVRAAAP